MRLSVLHVIAALIVSFDLSQAAREEARAAAHASRAAEAHGRMTSPPKCQWLLGTNKQGGTNKYALFLSHYKVEAGSDARYLNDLIRRMTGRPVYLDVCRTQPPTAPGTSCHA